MSTLQKAWPHPLALGTPPRLRWPARPLASQARAALARARGGLAALARLAARLRARPLILDLPERTVTINGLAELEFCLDSRTHFPAARVAALIALPDADIRRQAEEIRRVQKRFAAVLARTIHQPERIGDLMLALGTRGFTQDHDWREIAESVAHQPPAYDAYKRLVLLKYIEYLGARHQVLRSLHAAHPPPAGTTTTASGAPAAPLASADRTRVAAFQDTAIFAAPPTAVPGGGFLALPRGEPTRIELADGRELALRLGAEEFKLFPGPRFHLVDGAGAIHRLGEGRSSVGRHAENTVVISPRLRTVSRRHLVIEPLAVDAVLLTDLSSGGTFVPERYLRASR